MKNALRITVIFSLFFMVQNIYAFDTPFENSFFKKWVNAQNETFDIDVGYCKKYLTRDAYECLVIATTKTNKCSGSMNISSYYINHLGQYEGSYYFDNDIVCDVPLDDDHRIPFLGGQGGFTQSQDTIVLHSYLRGYFHFKASAE